jgi:hypothetical protein
MIRALVDSVPAMLRELEQARDNDETSGVAEDEDEDCVDPQVKRSRTLPRTRATNRDAELVRMLQWNSVLFSEPPGNIVVLLEKAMLSSYATCVLDEDSSELAVTIRRMIFVCFRSVLTDRLHALLGNRPSALRVFNVVAELSDVRSLGPLGLSDSVQVDAIQATWSRMLCGGVDRVLSSLRSTTKAETVVDGSKPVSVVQCLVEHETGLYHVAVPAEWLPPSIVMPNEFVPGRICMHTLDTMGCPDTDGIIAGLVASGCRTKIPCHQTVVGLCALKCRS